MKIIDFIADRIRERSTWAGVAALLALVGIQLTEIEINAIMQAIVGIFGVIAIFRKEKK